MRRFALAFCLASAAALAGCANPVYRTDVFKAQLTAPYTLASGDRIRVDMDAGTLDLLVSDEELARRREGWQPVVKPIPGRWLKRYARLVTSGSRGAVLDDGTGPGVAAPLPQWKEAVRQ